MNKRSRVKGAESPKWKRKVFEPVKELELISFLLFDDAPRCVVGAGDMP